MNKRFLLFLAAAAAFAIQAPAAAQTPPVGTDAALEVQRLAPQLVAFAGSEANFRNLVNGLAQGLPVTLVTLTADGLIQTVTFSPSGTSSPTDIARTLESARQQLISRGIAAPTAEQIGVTLAGGNLPTPAGTVRVGGIVSTITPGGVAPNASVGSTRLPPVGTTAGAPPLGTTAPASTVTIDVRPVTPVPAPGTSITAAPQTPAASSTAAPPRNISDNPRLGNTSDSIFPSANAPAAPTINPSTGVSNGAPSPAVQIQGNGAPSPAAQMQGRR
jgi:hypothetical protein